MNRKQRKEKLRLARFHSGYYTKHIKSLIVGKTYMLYNQQVVREYKAFKLYLGMKLVYLGSGVFASTEVCGHSGAGMVSNLPEKFIGHCIYLDSDRFI